MASVITNWGKGSCIRGAFAGVNASGAAFPANWYFVLIGTGYGGAEPGGSNPDHDTINEITDRRDPALLSAGTNQLARASGSWNVTIDDSGDLASLALATPLVITNGGSAQTNIWGFAICDANNITTARVMAIFQFTAPIASLGSAQTLTIPTTGIVAT